MYLPTLFWGDPEKVQQIMSESSANLPFRLSLLNHENYRIYKVYLGHMIRWPSGGNFLKDNTPGNV